MVFIESFPEPAHSFTIACNPALRACAACISGSCTVGSLRTATSPRSNGTRVFASSLLRILRRDARKSSVSTACSCPSCLNSSPLPCIPSLVRKKSLHPLSSAQKKNITRRMVAPASARLLLAHAGIPRLGLCSGDYPGLAGFWQRQSAVPSRAHQCLSLST